MASWTDLLPWNSPSNDPNSNGSYLGTPSPMPTMVPDPVGTPSNNETIAAPTYISTPAVTTIDDLRRQAGLPATPTPQTYPTSAPPPTPYPQAAPTADQSDLRAQARAAAAANNLDPDIYERLIQQESSFDPGAANPSGASGLAGLMPGTAQELGVDPSNPGQSLDGGARYLKQMLDRYGGDYGKALAAYNAGPGNVDQYGGIPPFAETQNYVATILTGVTPSSSNDASPAPTAMSSTQAAPAPQTAVAMPDGSTGTSLQGSDLYPLQSAQSSDPDIWAICGPIAAIAFARMTGRNPSVAEAKKLAADSGLWDPNNGMHGIDSEVSLLRAMGVAAKSAPADEQTMALDIQRGNPVIINGTDHYLVAEGVRQRADGKMEFNFGNSVATLAASGPVGNKRTWYTLDELPSLSSPNLTIAVRGAIYLDSPTSPAPSVVAGRASQPLSAAPSPAPHVEDKSGLQHTIDLLKQLNDSIQPYVSPVLNAGQSMIDTGTSASSSLSDIASQKASQIWSGAQDLLNKPASMLTDLGQSLTGNQQSDRQAELAGIDTSGLNTPDRFVSVHPQISIPPIAPGTDIVTSLQGPVQGPAMPTGLTPAGDSLVDWAKNDDPDKVNTPVRAVRQGISSAIIASSPDLVNADRATGGAVSGVVNTLAGFYLPTPAEAVTGIGVGEVAGAAVRRIPQLAELVRGAMEGRSVLDLGDLEAGRFTRGDLRQAYQSALAGNPGPFATTPGIVPRDGVDLARRAVDDANQLIGHLETTGQISHDAAINLRMAAMRSYFDDAASRMAVRALQAETPEEAMAALRSREVAKGVVDQVDQDLANRQLDLRQPPQAPEPDIIPGEPNVSPPTGESEPAPSVGPQDLAVPDQGPPLEAPVAPPAPDQPSVEPIDLTHEVVAQDRPNEGPVPFDVAQSQVLPGEEHQPRDIITNSTAAGQAPPDLTMGRAEPLTEGSLALNPDRSNAQTAANNLPEDVHVRGEDGKSYRVVGGNFRSGNESGDLVDLSPEGAVPVTQVGGMVLRGQAGETPPQILQYLSTRGYVANYAAMQRTVVQLVRDFARNFLGDTDKNGNPLRPIKVSADGNILVGAVNLLGQNVRVGDDPDHIGTNPWEIYGDTLAEAYSTGIPVGSYGFKRQWALNTLEALSHEIVHAQYPVNYHGEDFYAKVFTLQQRLISPIEGQKWGGISTLIDFWDSNLEPHLPRIQRDYELLREVTQRAQTPEPQRLGIDERSGRQELPEQGRPGGSPVQLTEVPGDGAGRGNNVQTSPGNQSQPAGHAQGVHGLPEGVDPEEHLNTAAEHLASLYEGTRPGNPRAPKSTAAWLAQHAGGIDRSALLDEAAVQIAELIHYNRTAELTDAQIATARRKAERLLDEAAPQAKPAEEPKHEFASTQLDIEPELAQKIVKAARTNIWRTDRVGTDAIETQPHVTVRFGLSPSISTADIDQVVGSLPPVHATLGEVRHFTGVNGDTVYLSVEGQGVHDLRAALNQFEAPGETHAEYVPHVSLGTVKAGSGAEVAARLNTKPSIKALVGQEIDFSHVALSDVQGEKEMVELGGQPSQQAKPGETSWAESAQLVGTKAPNQLVRNVPASRAESAQLLHRVPTETTTETTTLPGTAAPEGQTDASFGVANEETKPQTDSGIPDQSAGVAEEANPTPQSPPSLSEIGQPPVSPPDTAPTAEGQQPDRALIKRDTLQYVKKFGLFIFPEGADSLIPETLEAIAAEGNVPPSEAQSKAVVENQGLEYDAFDPNLKASIEHYAQLNPHLEAEEIKKLRGAFYEFLVKQQEKLGALKKQFDDGVITPEERTELRDQIAVFIKNQQLGRAVPNAGSNLGRALQAFQHGLDRQAELDAYRRYHALIGEVTEAGKTVSRIQRDVEAGKSISDDDARQLQSFGKMLSQTNFLSDWKFAIGEPNAKGVPGRIRFSDATPEQRAQITPEMLAKEGVARRRDQQRKLVAAQKAAEANDQAEGRSSMAAGVTPPSTPEFELGANFNNEDMAHGNAQERMELAKERSRILHDIFDETLQEALKSISASAAMNQGAGPKPLSDHEIDEMFYETIGEPAAMRARRQARMEAHAGEAIGPVADRVRAYSEHERRSVTADMAAAANLARIMARLEKKFGSDPNGQIVLDALQDRVREAVKELALHPESAEATRRVEEAYQQASFGEGSRLVGAMVRSFDHSRYIGQEHVDPKEIAALNAAEATRSLSNAVGGVLDHPDDENARTALERALSALRAPKYGAVGEQAAAYLASMVNFEDARRMANGWIGLVRIHPEDRDIRLGALHAIEDVKDLADQAEGFLYHRYAQVPYLLNERLKMGISSALERVAGRDAGRIAKDIIADPNDPELIRRYAELRSKMDPTKAAELDRMIDVQTSLPTEMRANLGQNPTESDQQSAVKELLRRLDEFIKIDRSNPGAALDQITQLHEMIGSLGEHAQKEIDARRSKLLVHQLDRMSTHLQVGRSMEQLGAFMAMYDAKNPASLGKAMRAMADPSFATYYREWGVMGLLSSFTTTGPLGVNVVGTLLNVGMEAVKWNMMFHFDSAAAALNPARGQEIFASEVGAAGRVLPASIREGAEEAGSIMRTGYGTSGRVDQEVLSGDIGEIHPELITASDKKIIAAVGWIGHFFSTRPLEAADMMIKTPLKAAMAEMERQRYADRHGIPVSEVNLLDHPEIVKRVADQSAEVMFQKRYKSMSNFMSGYRKYMHLSDYQTAPWEQVLQMLDATIIPFKNVAINETWQGVRRALVDPTYSLYRATAPVKVGGLDTSDKAAAVATAKRLNERRSKDNQTNADDVLGRGKSAYEDDRSQLRIKRMELLARAAMGLGLSLYAIAQALDGNLTGDAPTDDQQRDEWDQLKLKDRHIKIAGHWVSYDSTFAAIPFAIWANVFQEYDRLYRAQRIKGYSPDMAGVGSIALAGAGGAKSAIFNNFFLTQAIRLAGGVVDNSNVNVVKFLSNLATETITRNIPLSGMSRYAADLTDVVDGQRIARDTNDEYSAVNTIGRKVAAGIPYVREHGAQSLVEPLARAVGVDMPPAQRGTLLGGLDVDVNRHGENTPNRFSEDGPLPGVLGLPEIMNPRPSEDSHMTQIMHYYHLGTPDTPRELSFGDSPAPVRLTEDQQRAYARAFGPALDKMIIQIYNTDAFRSDPPKLEGWDPKVVQFYRQSKMLEAGLSYARAMGLQSVYNTMGDTNDERINTIKQGVYASMVREYTDYQAELHPDQSSYLPH